MKDSLKHLCQAARTVLVGSLLMIGTCTTLIVGWNWEQALIIAGDIAEARMSHRVENEMNERAQPRFKK